MPVLPKSRLPGPCSNLLLPQQPVTVCAWVETRQTQREGFYAGDGNESKHFLNPPAHVSHQCSLPPHGGKGTCASHWPFAAIVSLISTVPFPRVRVRGAGALQGAQGSDLWVFALVCAREGWEEPRQFCPSVWREPPSCKSPRLSPAGWGLSPCLALAAARGRCSPLLHYGMWVVGSG